MKDQMAEICVKAVLAVADLARKDVNLDLIKASGKRSSALCVRACLRACACMCMYVPHLLRRCAAAHAASSGPAVPPGPQ